MIRKSPLSTPSKQNKHTPTSKSGMKESPANTVANATPPSLSKSIMSMKVYIYL